MLSSTTSGMPTSEINRHSLFFQNLPDNFVLRDDPAQHRLLREYGAVFLARGGVTAPTTVIFKDQREVDAFQSQLDIAGSIIGEFFLELQAPAMAGLLSAIAKAANVELSITPRGADSARRNYNDTINLWESRVEPALVHWLEKGRITRQRADELRSLPPHEQVPEVFALEEDGIYFAKDLSKSIIYSVAPPGASQHLSLLAFDVAEFDNADVRSILANHYWYQTVTSDLPHFTFLGVEENELPRFGLKTVTNCDRTFWIPDI